MTCTPEQIRKLMKTKRTKSLIAAATKAGMSENTARKYVRRRGKPISKQVRAYRTRIDPFNHVWSDIEKMLAADPGLEAKTLMQWLLEQYPDQFRYTQVRTLQRRVRDWRAMYGPDKEVMFPQNLLPGRQSQSDYTHCNELGILIDGKPFEHMLFHFMLPYSRWETASIAYTESFKSLTEGYAAAVKELGSVAPEHRTDNLAAAVPIGGDRNEFQRRWIDFLAYYGVSPSANNPNQSHENGSVEKSHDLLKKALDQRLRLRGSRNFASIAAYEEFFQGLIARRNRDRKQLLAAELRVLKDVPLRGWSDPRELTVGVSPWSTVTILRSIYSVPSRLIGTRLKALVYADHIELYFGSKEVQRMARIRPGDAAVNYRHVISHLVRKPGAFRNYRFRDELFPTLVYRKSFDVLCIKDVEKGEKEYLKILNLAALNSESDVETALHLLMEAKEIISAENVQSLLAPKRAVPAVTVFVPDLAAYDHLLNAQKLEAQA